MKIIVCIKQVPDTTEVRLDPVTNTLIREGVPSIINPDDKAGLEAALRIKDKMGDKCHVTALSMGPLQADVALREALAMGADEAILVSDRAFGGADTWATSSTLAAAIRNLEYDLIITGRQAIDGDTAQVGPQIAEHLGLPHISYAENIELEEGAIVVQRQFEDRYHKIRCQLPCLITALSELNEPRYMTPGGVFDAFREKQVPVWTKDEVKMDPGNMGLKGSPTRVVKSFNKQARVAGPVEAMEPADGARAVFEKLCAANVVERRVH